MARIKEQELAEDIKFIWTDEFVKSLSKLERQGGKWQKAASQVNEVLGKINHDPRNAFKHLNVTNFGEQRIANAIKYDLTGYCRLVTVQVNKCCFLLYTGDHKTVDKWLEKNEGIQPAIDKNNTVVMVRGVGVAEKRHDEAPLIPTVGNLFETIPDFDDLFDLPRKVSRAVEGLNFFASYEDIFSAVDPIADEAQKTFLLDLLCLVRDGGGTEEISARIELELGDIQPINSETTLPDFIDSQTLRAIPVDDPAFPKALSQYAAQASYRDWMLFLHPSQEELVDANFAGPTRLTGVSGSGKTCVTIRRAYRLANTYPNDRILVVTLNDPLANLIRELFQTCDTTDASNRVEVKTFFDICRELILEFEPHNEKIYHQTTWKSDESIDEIWQEYYRCELNNTDAAVLHPIHDSLISQGFIAENYIREEFDWIRSAFFPSDRQSYLTVRRSGRSIPLGEDQRQLILEGLAGWEKKMAAIGIIDGLGVAYALHKYLLDIKPKYRSILIDESQDFGNVELDLIQRLVKSNENDLFLCGDGAQRITTKYHRPSEIGLNIPAARSKRLDKNYRNSEDILRLAHAIFMANVTEEGFDYDDFELLDPRFSNFSGQTPVLLKEESLNREIGLALNYLREKIEDENNDGKYCLAISGYSYFEIKTYSEKLGLPFLDGSKIFGENSLFVSDLEHTKGFEFDTICVVNCSTGVLPNPTQPEAEQYRDLARFYVAMTRAKTELILSYSNEKSPYLNHSSLDNFILKTNWSEWTDNNLIEALPSPVKLDEIRQANGDAGPVLSMNGSEFLYTRHATGLPISFTRRLRDLIDGKGLIRNNKRVRWKTLESAWTDYQNEVTARRTWGQLAGDQLKKLMTTIEYDD